LQGIDPADDLIIFQSKNLGRVNIKGVELKSELFLDTFWQAARGWRFNTSISYARGDDKETDQPLDAIDPPKGVFGLAYDHAGGNWGGELIWTVVDSKDRVDETDPDFQQFKTPGYGKLDLLGYYQFGEHSWLNFGVFNLTDKKYWQWGDSVIGRPADDPGLGRVTQPGLNAGISFRTEW
jgi:hemoglobin/transferrin/lactoferrin receptor protein